MENVKVIIWGLGSMGGGMADMLLHKKGVEIVGVVGRNKKIGTSMYDYIKTERGDRPDVIIQDESIIKPGAADIVLLCTDSFTKEAFPKMKYILEQKINVITSAEEMAFPAAQNPELAAELDKLNQQRKRFQTEAVNEISEQTPEGNVVVVSGKWHEGIVGIVAGRLVEMFHKPAFVLTEVDDGVLKGSGRSFGDFNLAQALSECQDCLLTGGGHAGACGLSLLKKDLPKFKKKIEQYYKGLKLKKQEKYLEVSADVATGNLKDLSVELLDELRQLEPFGEGNPEPVFELDKMRVMATRTVGSDGQHLQITLRDINGATFKTVAFSAPDEWMAIEEMTELNMKVRLSKNEWRGSVSVEGMIQDVTPVE